MKKFLIITIGSVVFILLSIWTIFFSTEFKKQLFFAKRHHSDAQVFIAKAYTDGTHRQPQNNCIANQWWKKAADQHNLQAHQHLGNLLIHHTEQLECIELSKDQMIEYMLYATEQGNYAGYFKLAEMPQIQPEQRIQYLESGALHNEPNALYALSSYYFHKNQSYTIYLLNKAAQLGNSKAQTFLADIYAGMTYTHRYLDYQKAIYWYTQAAQQQHVIAQKNLGLLYLYGQGSHQNYDQAAYWLKQASLQNDPESTLTLAMLVLFDRGISITQYGSKNQNFQIIQTLANNGYVEAQVELGRLHLFGISTLQDYHKAAEWFQIAANQTDRLAKYQLGLLYMVGKGVPNNQRKAQELFYQARYTEFLDTSKPQGRGIIDEGYPHFKTY